MQALGTLLRQLLDIAFPFFGYHITFGQFFFFIGTAYLIVGFIRGILE